MRYILDVNEQGHSIQSVQELQTHFDNVQTYPYVDLSLHLKSEEKPTSLNKTLDKLLGVLPLYDEACMGALINRDRNAALLTFEDEQENSYCSIDLDIDVAEENKVPFILASGQPDEYPASECVTIEQALHALVFFFETGRKPEWITWRKI